MTVRFDCDGPDCARRMGRDEPRIALVMEDGDKPPWRPGDDPEELEIERMIIVGFDGDNHFCSMECLTSWAYRKHLDNMEGGT